MSEPPDNLKKPMPDGCLPICGCVFPFLILYVAMQMDFQLGEYLHYQRHTWLHVSTFYHRNIATSFMFFAGCPAAVFLLAKSPNREYRKAATAYLIGLAIGALVVLTTV